MTERNGYERLVEIAQSLPTSKLIGILTGQFTLDGFHFDKSPVAEELDRRIPIPGAFAANVSVLPNGQVAARPLRNPKRVKFLAVESEDHD